MSQDPIAREAARWWLHAHDEQRDEAAFSQWYEADPRHAAQYQHLLQLWQAGAALPSLQRQQQRRQRRRLREAGIAVLLLCALGLYTRHNALPPEQTLRTASGEIEDVRLQDGSRLQLSPDSELGVRIDADRRALQLRHGQAWFQVAADRNRPFQVHTPHGTVTALGTAFDIAVSGDASIVTVTEHQVRVDSGTGSSEAAAGQQLRFDGTAPSAALAAAPAQLAWRDRRLAWVSAPLAAVVQDLDRWHGGHTWIAGDALRQQPVTVLADADTAARSRDQLAAELHVRVVRIGPNLQVWLPAKASSDAR